MEHETVCCLSKCEDAALLQEGAHITKVVVLIEDKAKAIEAFPCFLGNGAAHSGQLGLRIKVPIEGLVGVQFFDEDHRP